MEKKKFVLLWGIELIIYVFTFELSLIKNGASDPGKNLLTPQKSHYAKIRKNLSR